MKTLSIDIETFSDVDLNSCGVYKYAQSSNFYIMLFGYSVDGGDVQVVDLMSGQEIPAEILEALTDENVTKWAYNASFERVCLTRMLPNGHIMRLSRGCVFPNILDVISLNISRVMVMTQQRNIFLPKVGNVL